MEVICNLGDFEEDNKIEKIEDEVIEKISEFSIIPKVGIFLGLDISKNSSGVCMYENGNKISANISLDSKEGLFYEVRLRRELKECLSEMIKGKNIDLIIIEDAFEGENPKGTRILYAINTAIDELILDGICTCKKFIRVNNQQWKSWLFRVDVEGIYKGLEDKLRIQKCLELLDVHEDIKSEGYQDRLDSCGMLLGYLLYKDEIDKDLEFKSKQKILFEDVDFSYNTEVDFCLEEAGYGVRDISKIFIDERKVSKEIVLKYLRDNPRYIYIIKEKVKLGIFGNSVGLPIIEDGGYFAFWVKEEKLKKYLKEEEL